MNSSSSNMPVKPIPMTPKKVGGELITSTRQTHTDLDAKQLTPTLEAYRRSPRAGFIHSGQSCSSTNKQFIDDDDYDGHQSNDEKQKQKQQQQEQKVRIVGETKARGEKKNCSSKSKSKCMFGLTESKSWSKLPGHLPPAPPVGKLAIAASSSTKVIRKTANNTTKSRKLIPEAPRPHLKTDVPVRSPLAVPSISPPRMPNLPSSPGLGIPASSSSSSSKSKQRQDKKLLQEEHKVRKLERKQERKARQRAEKARKKALQHERETEEREQRKLAKREAEMAAKQRRDEQKAHRRQLKQKMLAELKNIDHRADQNLEQINKRADIDRKTLKRKIKKEKAAIKKKYQ